mmetsp:Transcript_25754/g.39490  ORF Transcript_25754/g.39490 Transcript_25754/m.39490 type:complete len:213 (+) Transcript_25754:3-641(+)
MRFNKTKFSSLASVTALFCLVATPPYVMSFTGGIKFGRASRKHSGSNLMAGKEETTSSTATATAKGEFEVQTRNPLRLAVLKLGMTEPAWTSPLNYEKKEGFYNCAYCGQTLFDSESKYDSGSGWPSFWKSAADGRVALKREWDGRLECSCSKCDGHLGHVFPDGPKRKEISSKTLATIPDSDPKLQTTNLENARLPRFCVNGASLRFVGTK